MNRVNWNGEPLSTPAAEVPQDIAANIFSFAPPPIEFTPEMSSLAERYLGGDINWQEYRPMQAAAFLKPASEESHALRREKFEHLVGVASNEGFSLPETFHTLVESDDLLDRIHHNTIWLQLPDELWRLPADPTKLMFLAFAEGQGCCSWHLLLSKDGSHQIACSEHPFGLVTNWPNGVPDYSKWEVEICADSIEEWLYHYFIESEQYDQRYLKYLASHRAQNGE